MSNKAFENIKRKFEENPVEVIGVGALVATAAAKVLHALTERKNARTWAKEVNRREYKTRYPKSHR